MQCCGATRWWIIACWAVGILFTSLPALAAEPPFFDLRTHQTEYAGPGRDAPEPEKTQEVLLGYFGPGDPAHPDAGDLWFAAQIAIEEANREGGYRGKPFKLVSRWSDNPWKAGAAQVTRLVYVDRVWAIVGGIDSATAHLAEQVVAKARLPLLASGSTDRTANMANVPWMFSALPGDHLQSPRLVERLAANIGKKPFVVISSDAHDSRQFVAEVDKALVNRQLAPSFRFTFQASLGEVSDATRRAIDAKPDAILVVADAHDSARVVTRLRAEGFRGLMFGGPAMGRRRFVAEAGGNAEGVVFPLLVDPSVDSCRFQETFRAKRQHEPDYAAACTYDSVRMLVAAVRKAGLNRARIGDAIRDLSGWKGATGTICWDKLGSNTRPILLGTIRESRLIESSAR